MPKVTVIIPTYRRPGFLKKAIQSVFDQTFQDFEIIVVDDASGDNTGELIKSINDGRLRYICHAKNSGGSTARNTGIEAGRGTYIAFLDDDDEWFPRKLELQVKLLDACFGKVGVIYTGSVLVDADNGKVLRQKTPYYKGNLTRALLTRNIIGTTSSVLIRKECFSEVGGFDGTLPSYQDYDMWIRLSRKFHFEIIKEPLVKYHVHDRKIWSNLEVLKEGLALMLKKYECNACTFKKTFGYYGYLDLGMRYCLNRELQNGKDAFVRAIRLYPFGLQPYFQFCLTLLGADTFKKVVDMKKRIMTPTRMFAS